MTSKDIRNTRKTISYEHVRKFTLQSQCNHNGVDGNVMKNINKL